MELGKSAMTVGFADDRRISPSRARILCIRIFLCLISLFLFALPNSAGAQIRPVYDQGALGLGQLLKRLNTRASVLMVGAHPDDEDTALLAYLARGENARTAYLSLTRGDGGQNIIGPELGEALGVIRTEELLQARKLDGAEQYFTRAYDYGFSKTLDEAKQQWDEKIVLCDVVRVIRNFQPLVVVSQFSGTAADGHGQHQYSGYITPLAVRAAADNTQCTGSGPVWKASKFYVRHGFRATGEPGLRINTGKYDPLLGRSYFEIAMEGRSQHKSQEQGVLELKGDQFSGLNLVESNVPRSGTEVGIFDGIDTSPGVLDAEMADIAARALREYDPETPEKIVPILVQGHLKASAAGHKQQEFAEAIRRAAGIRIDALADVETVAPGGTFEVAVKVFYPPSSGVKVTQITLDGLPASRKENGKQTDQSPFRREMADAGAYFTITAPPTTRYSQPYWLTEGRPGGLYSWSGNLDAATAPFQAPVLTAAVVLEIAGRSLSLIKPVEYRYADDIRGEVRRSLGIVPPVSVSLDQEILIVPYSDKPQSRRVVMRLVNNSARSASGTASLNDASGSLRLPPASAFELKSKGEQTVVAFDITIPARTKHGTYRITGQAKVGGVDHDRSMHTIAYPHMQTHRFYTAAGAAINIFELKTVPAKIGYIMGSGDGVADAIRRMGLEVEMLDAEQLLTGDLSRFDTIVAGVRASQVRPDFVAGHRRLMDYVRNGGNLIVQYQRTDYAKLLPFPAKMGARVADETAPVKLLQPGHPFFGVPNKITDEDFKGWVQEQNLYALTEMDSQYVALLESHDPGEPENSGGLVTVKIGRGNYTYCAYSIFRQLPAGVPGAYRLFANLLAAGKTVTE